MGKKARRARIIPAKTTYRVSLDEFLSQKQLWRKSIAKDGSCLFRAVAEQVYPSQNYYQSARLRCAEYIQNHQDDFKEFLTVPIDEYLTMLRDGKLWGGEVELVALSKLYGRPLVVYNEQEDSVQEQVFPSSEEEEQPTSAEQLQDPILLAYSDGNHYDSVYTIQHKSSTALCQAIVYSILYERVLKERIPFHCKERLKTLTENDKIFSPMSDDRALMNLRKHYPAESIICMAPQLCRNVAMDVYQRERASIEQRDRHVAASIQFQVGDKCQVKLPEGQTYRGEVTRLDVTHGCHMVYVYECHEEWEIPYKDITLPPSASNVPASARRNTSSYQNRPPKTQSRPLVPDRATSQHPHNPHKDTHTPSATPRDSQSTRPHNPPPSTSKDTQPARTPSAPPRDPLPPRAPPTKSKEMRLHSGSSREARKTTGQRRENTEGSSASNSSQKFRGEKQAKEVKKIPVKPTVSTPTLDNVSFPPLPSSKMIPSSNGGEVVIGKETVPLQATTEDKSINPVQNRLGGGNVDTSLHKKGAMRKTTTPGGQVTVTPVQVSLPPVKVPSSSSFPPSGVNLTKTPPGPHGSLTSDDSSYSSSSDESPNGNHPVNATSTNANQNLVFQFQPFPLPDQLVTGAWDLDSKQPDSKRYARERGDLQKRGSSKEQKTKLKNKLPHFSDAGVGEQLIGGRESPYLEPQIPRAKDSSQPEDAWPMIIVESTSPPLHPPPPPPSDTPNLNMPLPMMMHTLPSCSHPALPPGSHAALITAPIPMVPSPLNETHMQASVSPTMSMIPPLMTVQQPNPAKVSCADHSTQTSIPKLQKKLIQVHPEVRSCLTQTESTKSCSVYSQTMLHSTVLPVDDLRPPPLPKESDMANLRFIIGYAAQCLKAYSLYSGESVDGTLAMVEQFEEKGLPNMLEDVDTISSASSKEDNPIKLLDSEQQTFIQSLTKPPNLPAHDKKIHQHSKSKKQTNITNPASKPDQLVNPTQPNQEAPKRVIRSQTNAKSSQAKLPPSQNSQELHPQTHVPLPAATTLLQKPPEAETKGENIKPLIPDASKKSPALEKPAEDQERKGESSGLHPMEMLPQQEHAMHPYPPLPHPQMMMAGARPPGIMVGMPMPPVWPYPPHMGIQMVPVYMPHTPFAHQMMPPAAGHMMSNQTLAPDLQPEDPDDPIVYELPSESGSELPENDQISKLQSVKVNVGTTLELLAQDIREQGAEEDEPGVYNTQEENPSEPEQTDDYQEYAASDGVEDTQGDLYPKNYPPQEDLSSTLEEAHHESGSESYSEVEHDSQMSTPTSRPETPENTGKQPTTLPSLPCRGPSTPTHTHEIEPPKKERSQESRKESKVLRESKLSKASQPPVAPANKEEVKGVTEVRTEPQLKWNRHRFSVKPKGRTAGVGAARGGAASSSGSGKLSGSGRQQKPTPQEGGQPVHSTGNSQGRSFNRDRRAGRPPRQHGGSSGSGRTTQESTRSVPYSTEDRAPHNTSTHLPPFKTLFSFALPSADDDCRDTYKKAQDCSSANVCQWPWPLGNNDTLGEETTHTTSHPGSFLPHKTATRFSSTQPASKLLKDDLRRQLNSESGVLYQWEIEAHYS